MQLLGAVALVTGASSGIGAATAAALAAAGARLILTGRDPKRLRAVADRTGATAIAADLTEPGEAARLAAEAAQVAGHVDVLVSNAGVGWAGPMDELSAEKAAELVAVNLVAPIQLSRLLTRRWPSGAAAAWCSSPPSRAPRACGTRPSTPQPRLA